MVRHQIYLLNFRFETKGEKQPFSMQIAQTWPCAAETRANVNIVRQMKFLLDWF